MAVDVRPTPNPFDLPGQQGQPLGKVREQAERDYILSILKQTEGRRGEAAQILGISRKTLWKKLKHMGVTWPLDVT
jgi:DNA-binding NtrC family response regulator